MFELSLLAAAATLATALASPAVDDEMSPPPPPQGDVAPPAPRRPAPRDRGLLAGPEVDPAAAEGRQPFGRGDRSRSGGGEGQGPMAQRLERGMSMLVAAIRKTEPTPEEAEKIRAYFAGMREKAAKLGEENGTKLRDLLRMRRDAVESGESTEAIDREIQALRSSVVDPRKVVEEVSALLSPERRVKLRENLEAARREAAERARRERVRGGRPDGDAMSDDAMSDSPMSDRPARDRRMQDRGDRPQRGRGDRPPLDLGETPPPPPKSTPPAN